MNENNVLQFNKVGAAVKLHGLHEGVQDIDFKLTNAENAITDVCSRLDQVQHRLAMLEMRMVLLQAR